MNKLKKLFRVIAAVAKRPYLLNHVLEDNDLWSDELSALKGSTFKVPFLPFETLLTEKGKTVNPFSFLDGGSLPTDLALLKSLASRFTECSYFEIGTWRGESVANVATVAAHCTTLNLSKNEMLALGWDEKYADLHGFYSNRLENVSQITGNSLLYDFRRLNGPFDLIFIDGDHHHEAVISDTRNVFKHLLHKQSIVVWHDAAFTPEKLRFEVLSAIYKGVPPEFHDHIFVVSNTQCAVFLPDKPQEFFYPEFPQKPLISFSVQLNPEKPNG